MGLYDDHKYVQMMNEEFNKPEPNADDMSWINAIKGDSKVIEQITDPIYETRIQLVIKEGH